MNNYAFILIMYPWDLIVTDDALYLLFMFRVDFLHKIPPAHPIYMLPANHWLVTLLSILWNGSVQQGNQ